MYEIKLCYVKKNIKRTVLRVTLLKYVFVSLKKKKKNIRDMQ